MKKTETRLLAVSWAKGFLGICLSVGAGMLAMNAWAFSSFEHKEAGDEGFRAAVVAFETATGTKPFQGIPRIRVGEGPNGLMKDNLFAGSGGDFAKEVAYFSFGDLVAIYGDYRADFEALNGAKTKPEDAAHLKEIVFTGNLDKFQAEQVNVLDLAQTNDTHFSRRAVETYLKWHDQALRLAANKADLWRALHYEALALHSYTDLFAVGHMLGSRENTMRLLAELEAEAKRDAASKSKSPFSTVAKLFRKVKRAVLEEKAKKWYGFLANVAHNGFNYHGATARNLHGDEWKAYGDRRYRRCGLEPLSADAIATRTCGKSKEIDTQRQREIIRQGVQTSILQLLLTAHGKPPAAPERYAALKYLPVSYKDAATSKDLWKQKLAVVKALIKQNVHVISDAGLKASLLEVQKIPDGSVGYLDFVRQKCGGACGRMLGAR